MAACGIWYLRQHGWKPARRYRGQEVAGLCPLHRETQPSSHVNERKQVFYCHVCGQGGDLIRLVELLHGLSFPQALARLQALAPPVGLREEIFRF